MATIITFLISAIAHELVMACITKKVRGFGFIAQMMQLPIVVVQRTKWVKGRNAFNVSTRLALHSFSFTAVQWVMGMLI